MTSSISEKPCTRRYPAGRPRSPGMTACHAGEGECRPLQECTTERLRSITSPEAATCIAQCRVTRAPCKRRSGIAGNPATTWLQPRAGSFASLPRDSFADFQMLETSSRRTKVRCPALVAMIDDDRGSVNCKRTNGCEFPKCGASNNGARYARTRSPVVRIWLHAQARPRHDWENAQNYRAIPIATSRLHSTSRFDTVAPGTM